MGMGYMHAWLVCAALAGVPLALLGTGEGGRLCAMGTLHPRLSGGTALDDECSQPPPWWPRRSRPIHAERAASPKSASIASKLISTKSGTCANDATTVMRVVGQCSKTCRALRLSSCMVHQGASTRRAPLPDTPTKFPETFHAPGDTRGHGRWITITGARQRNRLRAMR